MTEETVKTVEGKLAIQWSPEQISGWLKKENKPSVSHETIYKYIWITSDTKVKSTTRGGRLQPVEASYLIVLILKTDLR